MQPAPSVWREAGGQARQAPTKVHSRVRRHYVSLPAKPGSCLSFSGDNRWKLKQNSKQRCDDTPTHQALLSAFRATAGRNFRKGALRTMRSMLSTSSIAPWYCSCSRRRPISSRSRSRTIFGLDRSLCGWGFSRRRDCRLMGLMTASRICQTFVANAIIHKSCFTPTPNTRSVQACIK